ASSGAGPSLGGGGLRRLGHAGRGRARLHGAGRLRPLRLPAGRLAGGRRRLVAAADPDERGLARVRPARHEGGLRPGRRNRRREAGRVGGEAAHDPWCQRRLRHEPRLLAVGLADRVRLEPAGRRILPADLARRRGGRQRSAADAGQRVWRPPSAVHARRPSRDGAALRPVRDGLAVAGKHARRGRPVDL
ncbi:MAG: hypothetical protein AVDCRST_MAG85-3787, partial [uncultured Solirubrobacteraceae bacterium]